MAIQRTQTVSRNPVWSSTKRYKVNETVRYNNNVYQNVTGFNSEPGVGLDWILLTNDISTKLDKDLTGISSLSLPALDTDLFYVNRGGTWYKVAKSDFVTGGGGSSSDSIIFEVAISQNIAASPNWYSRLTSNQNIFNATFTASGTLTDSNDFADHPIQTACNILPFQGKLKKVIVRGHSNIAATNVRMVILKSFGNNVTVVASSLIIADKTFNTHSPDTSYYLAEFSGSELDTTTVLDLGTEIRVLLFNNNVASNLYTTVVSIEIGRV